MLVVRPAGPSDLDSLLELAILSGPGFTSLPEDADVLSERLDISRDSFTGTLPPQERWYTLMLEDTATGDVDGVGSVKAAVGLKRPFFSFRIVNHTQSSPSMNVRLDHQTLVLVNECTGWTEVGSLFLKADRRKGGAGRLLSQSRYMLIAPIPTCSPTMCWPSCAASSPPTAPVRSGTMWRTNSSPWSSTTRTA